MFTPTTPEAQERARSVLWCCFYGGGIIGFLLIYGLLQERIMVMPYGDPPQMFTDSVFLVFCNRLVAVFFSLCVLAIRGESFRNGAPLWKYLAISVSNVYASTCQYEALKYVTFPVQMLGKSFKMMPVMVWGIAVSGKRYKPKEWCIAAAITGGVTEFLMTGPIDSKSHVAGNSFYGLALLALFLGLDGFTSTFQEKLFKDHVTTKYNQLLYVNLGSCAISSFTLIASGNLGHAIQFMAAHPRFAMDAMMLSFAAVASQWFIISQVKEFGALVFAATMNVRQVVSIILSYITYGKLITRAQIFGLMLVFSALFYKSFEAATSSGEKRPLQAEAPPAGAARYDSEAPQSAETKPAKRETYRAQYRAQVLEREAECEREPSTETRTEPRTEPCTAA